MHGIFPSTHQTKILKNQVLKVVFFLFFTNEAAPKGLGGKKIQIRLIFLVFDRAITYSC